MHVKVFYGLHPSLSWLSSSLLAMSGIPEARCLSGAGEPRPTRSPRPWPGISPPTSRLEVKVSPGSKSDCSHEVIPQPEWHTTKKVPSLLTGFYSRENPLWISFRSQNQVLTQGFHQSELCKANLQKAGGPCKQWSFPGGRAHRFYYIHVWIYE